MKSEAWEEVVRPTLADLNGTPKGVSAWTGNRR